MTADKLTAERVQVIIKALPSLLGQQPQLDSNQDWVKQLLADYFRLVEIAHYVRQGGVKVMIYRLETGKTELVAVDYLDDAHARLSSTYRRLYTVAEAGERTLLERLHAITPEEEATVRRLLPELDEVVLQEKRLEAVLSDEQWEQPV